jgi:PPK2 family polyphosphate:nucleotide phosphotransferase
MLKEKIEILKVNPGEEFFLDKTPSRIKRLYADRDEYKKLLKKYKRNIDYLQLKFYASASHALLVILQGMDTSGKDSMIRHVMSGVNPQGCGVFSFKKPSMEELQHDYLWRYQHKMPPSGMIGIFNRSYYEDIVVPVVHPDILKNKSEDWFNQRCLQINEYEKYLTENKVVVMKFFLHLSKKEQTKRLLKRVKSPSSNWKFSMDDLLERKHWKHYQQAYEQCLNKTSTEYAPWYILPADDKKNARIMLSYILCEKLCDLKVGFPVQDEKRKKILKKAERLLE